MEAHRHGGKSQDKRCLAHKSVMWSKVGFLPAGECRNQKCSQSNQVLHHQSNTFSYQYNTFRCNVSVSDMFSTDCDDEHNYAKCPSWQDIDLILLVLKICMGCVRHWTLLVIRPYL